MTERIMDRKTDVLVIGGGAAGQMAALEAAQSGSRVLIITDGGLASTGILGFCALVSDEDSEECFFRDTWEGGQETGDPQACPDICKRYHRGSKKARKHRIGL